MIAYPEEGFSERREGGEDEVPGLHAILTGDWGWCQCSTEGKGMVLTES